MIHHGCDSVRCNRCRAWCILRTRWREYIARNYMATCCTNIVLRLCWSMEITAVFWAPSSAAASFATRWCFYSGLCIRFAIQLQRTPLQNRRACRTFKSEQNMKKWIDHLKYWKIGKNDDSPSVKFNDLTVYWLFKSPICWAPREW